jgi:hypothetical protein
MMRIALHAFALVLLFSAAAWAQTDQTFSLGRRAAGEMHMHQLTARNTNCSQPLDFRFEFAPSPWLRPRGESVVRGVPAGESRSLSVIVDLTQMAPGTHTAQVDVVCENCRVFLFANCRFDRQHLNLSVEAVAAQAPVPPPQPDVATPPQPARRTESAPRPPVQSAIPSLDPTPAASAPVITNQTPAPCDCGGAIVLWQAAAGAAGLLALASLGWGMMASASSRAARAALVEMARAGGDNARSGGDAESGLALKAMEHRLKHLEVAADRAAAELAALAQAQLQAMRVLSALDQVDPASAGADADRWTSLSAGAGLYVNEAAGRVVPDRGEGRMRVALEAVRGGQRDERDLMAGGAGRDGLDWLIAHGFAHSDAAATAILHEIASWRTHTGMSDMVARLERAIETHHRTVAEARALEAQIEALELGA